jgi:hypothetical protein
MAMSAEIQALLKRYGLEELAGWASLMIISGASPDAIELSLYDQPAFKTRFKGIFDLEASGKPPISVDEYLSYEQTVHANARAWGLALTKDEVDRMIGGGVSVVESEKRIGLAGAAMFETSPQARAELKRLYGINDNQLIRLWALDTNTELAKLQQQFTAGRISAMASAAGYDVLSAQEAETLVSSGVTEEGAQEGFSNLTRMRELFDPIDRTEGVFNRGQQLEFLATGKGAEQLERRARRRVAAFEEGGEFSTGEEGVVGLGSAAT